jgi:hypothetical protein
MIRFVEVIEEKIVEPGKDRRSAWFNESFRHEDRARFSHEHRGADAVPGDVADETVDAMALAGEVAEIVTTYGHCRDAATCPLHTRNRERIFGQQRALDLSRYRWLRA